MKLVATFALRREEEDPFLSNSKTNFLSVSRIRIDSDIGCARVCQSRGQSYRHIAISNNSERFDDKG